MDTAETSTAKLARAWLPRRWPREWICKPFRRKWPRGWICKPFRLYATRACLLSTSSCDTSHELKWSCGAQELRAACFIVSFHETCLSASALPRSEAVPAHLFQNASSHPSIASAPLHKPVAHKVLALPPLSECRAWQRRPRRLRSNPSPAQQNSVSGSGFRVPGFGSTR